MAAIGSNASESMRYQGSVTSGLNVTVPAVDTEAVLSSAAPAALERKLERIITLGQCLSSIEELLSPERKRKL